jgi:hypothetical protein
VIAVLIVAQLTAARLSPEEAVRVLRASRSPQDLTDYHVPPTSEPHVAVVERPRPAPQPVGVVAPPVATPPFNYGDLVGRWPALVQIVGDVRVVK